MKEYEPYLDRLVMDGIEEKCTLSEILLGLKEVSGKLDTIIILKQVELQHQSPQQEQPLSR